MKRYKFTGYDYLTGEKKDVIVSATTTKHARTLAKQRIRRATLVERISRAVRE